MQWGSFKAFLTVLRAAEMHLMHGYIFLGKIIDLYFLTHEKILGSFFGRLNRYTTLRNPLARALIVKVV